MSFKYKISRHVYDAGMMLAKNAPAIAFGAGLVGMAGTVILTARATLKVAPKLEAHEESLRAHKETARRINEGLESEGEFPGMPEASFILWARFVRECTRAYAVPLLLGGVSAGLLTYSHNVQSNMIAGLTMAYEGLKVTFDKYREAVIEDQGIDADTKYIVEAHNAANEELQARTGDSEVFHVDSRFVFGTESSSDFNGRASMWNVNFLNDVEAAMNRKLEATGIVFLNEVLVALGMDRTPAGQQLGWVKNPDDSSHVGIDFGWRKLADEMTKHHLINADSSDSAPEILLDFNYDGIVWDKL